MKAPKDWFFSHKVNIPTGFKERCQVCLTMIGEVSYTNPLYVYKDIVHNTKTVCKDCHKDTQRKIKQTDLVSNFGFPDVPKNLRLGDKKNG
jgi:hypothetical protein